MKTKNMGKHRKKYLKVLKFEDVIAIFMALSGMLDLKAIYRKNIQETVIATCVKITKKKIHINI